MFTICSVKKQNADVKNLLETYNICKLASGARAHTVMLYVISKFTCNCRLLSRGLAPLA